MSKLSAQARTLFKHHPVMENYNNTFWSLLQEWCKNKWLIAATHQHMRALLHIKPIQKVSIDKLLRHSSTFLSNALEASEIQISLSDFILVKMYTHKVWTKKHDVTGN